MANINKLFQDEVRRLARKEIKEASAGMKSEYLKLRKAYIGLKRRLDDLERSVKMKTERHADGNTAKTATPREKSRPRITGKTVRQLRQRLRLTQAEFGELLGVSGQSVYQWERRDDLLRLRHATIEAFLRAKSMGLKEARRRLGSVR